MIDDVKIKDVVDVKKYPYVVPYDIRLDTWFGTVRLIRGRLLDGATGVRDLDFDAFAAHDTLYAYPVTLEGKRLSKTQCDIIYAQLLWRAADQTKLKGSHWYNKVAYSIRKRYRRFAAVWRPVGLHYLGKQAWRTHRENEHTMGAGYQEWMSQEYFVTRKACWDFPSKRTKDAVWIGIDRSSHTVDT